MHIVLSCTQAGVVLWHKVSVVIFLALSIAFNVIIISIMHFIKIAVFKLHIVFIYFFNGIALKMSFESLLFIALVLIVRNDKNCFSTLSKIKKIVSLIFCRFYRIKNKRQKQKKKILFSGHFFMKKVSVLLRLLKTLLSSVLSIAIIDIILVIIKMC